MASINIADREWDLIGPTVDDDVNRMINRYGAVAVCDAIKRRTKKQPGRKLDNDQAQLRSTLDEQAKIWLAGGDPFAAPSNYAIAKEYSEKIEGNSGPAIFRRLTRKLAKYRKSWVLERAYFLSFKGYPYQLHIRALEELIQISNEPIWRNFLDFACDRVVEYEAKVGGAPPADTDMYEVEQLAMNPIRGIGPLQFARVRGHITLT